MRTKASPVSPPPRTSAVVADEIADLDAIARDRGKALAALEAQRPGLIDSADVDGVERLDAKIRRGRIEAEVSAARREKLAAEHDALQTAEDHRADQAARRAAFVAARDAAKDAHRLYREEYPRLARELASLLSRVAECRTLVEEANERLPEGEAPIPMDFEPYRGRAAIPASKQAIRRHVWVHRSGKESFFRPAEKAGDWKREVRNEEVATDPVCEILHVPIHDLVSLPGLRLGEAPFWSPKPFAFAKPVNRPENWRNFITDPPASSPAPVQPAGSGR